MQSATVRTRVRADSSAETVRRDVACRVGSSCIQFTEIEFFFPPLFLFVIRLFVPVQRGHGLVKYQMRHFYRGFIVNADDKLWGIKAATARSYARTLAWCLR